jgi:hypothetical protein
MNRFIEEELDIACKEEGLSIEACKAIKALLNRKLNNEIQSNKDFTNDLSRVYVLIQESFNES